MSILPLVTTLKSQYQYSLDKAFIQTYYLLQIYFYLYVILLFFKIHELCVLTNFIATSLQTPFITHTLLSTNSKLPPFKTLHWLVFSFTCVNLTTSEYLFFYNKIYPCHSSLFWLDSLYASQTWIYVNEGISLNQAMLTPNANFQLLKNWTTAISSNSTDSNRFSLWLNSNTVVNCIQFTSDYLLNAIIIEFNEINLLNLISFMLIFKLKNLVQNQKTNRFY
jgi:hypothetical protein